jgi:23S rRNA pseudouridine1911/1915/1917 synthase
MEKLYEDEYIVVVDKPSGLVVHSDGRTAEATVVDWFLEHYPNTKNVGETLILSSGEEILRPGIVHRLDRDTSGVLLLCKTDEAFTYFKKQFQNRLMKKTYLAFVVGEMKYDEGEIDRGIGRSKSDFRRWTAQQGIRGVSRDANTLYKVLLRGGGYSLVELCPQTGRTHQLRVHMKAINYPIVGDKLYSPKNIGKLGFERTALHAKSISFTHINGEEVFVEAAEPKEFIEARTKLSA